ncbi:MAG: protein kinase [Anaerolineales bacterium]|nr:protein kinase [Anaerolineales bacterium]
MKLYPLTDIKPGFQIGSFKVIELCEDGRGGMSQVVKAIPLSGKQVEVALKISRTGDKQEYFFAALQKEVEILQKLNHPGVVRLVPVSQGKNPYKERAVEIIGSPWFFGMEYLHGGSLDNYIDRFGPLTMEETAAICFQVSAALVYIHVEGFSHNDLKPENVLFRHMLQPGKRLEPVLIDFGVAVKLVKHQPDGSVVYMSPERLQEIRELGEHAMLDEQVLMKADVWSMGVLLYRMLAGREPFLGVTDRSITTAIRRASPESIRSKRSDVPEEMDKFVIEGCLAKRPEERVSMQEFHEFIGSYTHDWRMKRALRRKRRLFRFWR